MINFSTGGESSPTKRCGGCNRILPVAEFCRNRSQQDGLSFYCSECRRITQKRSKAARAQRDGRNYSPRPQPEPVPDGMRRCPDCRRVLPLDDFVRNRSARQGRGTYCRPCQRARVRESRIRVHGDSRHYHLTHRYGIGSAEFDELFAQQRGLCAICHIEAAEHVDHDHGTGAVRGLLCFTCNVGLGNFKDDPRRLLSAVDYLEGYMYFGGVGGTGAA